jgi:hypothetical protein
MDILTTKSNGILTIEFNRPERKNAITGAMYTTMADALRGADQDPPCAPSSSPASPRSSPPVTTSTTSSTTSAKAR